ncbi:MAG: ABC transporter permease [Bryobacteraceae bacterium]
MNKLLEDLRYGGRTLRKSPGLLFAAIVSLGLGIGANTSIFSLLNAILLRPLPVERPEEMISIFTSDYSGPLYGSTSYPDYLDIREASAGLMTGVTAYTGMPVNLTLGERTERIIAAVASGNYFNVLRVTPLLGRTFHADEDATPGTHPVVMLSEGLWKREFGSDQAVLGRTVRLNGHDFTIIGVVPEQQSQLARMIRVDVFVPLMMQEQLQRGSSNLTSRGSRAYMVWGRLGQGVTLDQAQARLSGLAVQLHRQYPEEWTDLRQKGRRLTVLPESASRVPPQYRMHVAGFMAVLVSVVALVLLIACANLANLLLARADARRREIAVRLAVGAGRWRLVLQLATENLLLSLMGGAAGLALARWTTDLLMTFQPPLGVPLQLDLGMDLRVLCFALALSVLTSLVFGLAPALHATRADLSSSLKGTRQAASAKPRRLSARKILVAGQAATSLVLLISAGLFLRSLMNAHAVDLGFDPGNIALLSIDLESQGYNPERGRAFHREMAARLRAVPGVERVDMASSIPLSLSRSRRRFAIEGYTARPNEDRELHFNIVGPEYFETMRIPVVQGREFDERDRDGAPRVVVVNEAFAAGYWPGQDAVGKRISQGNVLSQPMEVIGVARTGKYNSLAEEAIPFVYMPLLQNYLPSVTVHVRTASNPAGFLRVLRNEIAMLDKDLPVFDVKTMNEHLALALLPARMAATLLTIFGGVALCLAMVGLYGVLAYSVARRSQEIGVRMALGANRGQVLWLIIRQGMAIVLAGIGAGLLCASAATHLFSSFLYGVNHWDAATFVGASLLLAVAALAASYLPARKASLVEPMIALRED